MSMMKNHIICLKCTCTNIQKHNDNKNCIGEFCANFLGNWNFYGFLKRNRLYRFCLFNKHAAFIDSVSEIHKCVFIYLDYCFFYFSFFSTLNSWTIKLRIKVRVLYTIWLPYHMEIPYHLSRPFQKFKLPYRIK